MNAKKLTPKTLLTPEGTRSSLYFGHVWSAFSRWFFGSTPQNLEKFMFVLLKSSRMILVGKNPWVWGFLHSALPHRKIGSEEYFSCTSEDFHIDTNWLQWYDHNHNLSIVQSEDILTKELSSEKRSKKYLYSLAASQTLCFFLSFIWWGMRPRGLTCMPHMVF